ncbi:Altered inheritance of mitochondria protein 6 [Gnomoniopsis smithogilvyi]|uniref:Altered inheritance of mitochondria protein 6 n=1 Tax=Gnomoniopsis smithogilvyi TaxID=1191159 RepID=A0A9W9CXH2_9PEZI|nr:Altered inheritance of mitochondria protein 6 [Gnomoniopsis smithogilvyi]
MSTCATVAHGPEFLNAPLSTLPDDNVFWSSTDAWQSEGFTHNTTLPPEVLSVSRTLYYPENSYYASVSFKQTIGSVRFGFSDTQLERLREQTRIANLSQLQARYWDIPDWPINYRDYIWAVLTREGVGMLSIDDIDAVSTRAWTPAYMVTVQSNIMGDAYTDVLKYNEALKTSLGARNALLQHIRDHLQTKDYTASPDIIGEFSQLVTENVVPIADMQSQLARIMDIADEDELRARFAGFLNAPVDSESQQKAALYEIRDALLIPREDDPSIMTHWLRAMRAASIQWSRDDPQRWGDYSTKLSHHMTRRDHRDENQRALEAMAVEGKVRDTLCAYFSACERDYAPAMGALDVQGAI